MTDTQRNQLAQAARNAQDVANLLHDWARRLAKPRATDAEKLRIVLLSVSAAVDAVSEPCSEPRPVVRPKHDRRSPVMAGGVA